MKIVYPSSSFLFSDDSPTVSKLWGCILNLPRPEDASFKSSHYIICDKCGALKTSKGNVCPICHPDTPYNGTSDKFVFSDCLLTNDKIKKSPNPLFEAIVCLTFDISSSSSLFQQVIYTISSQNFQEEFSGCGFIFAFLIKDTAVFVTKEENGKSDNLSFDKIPRLTSKNCFFTSETISNALIDAFSIVQVMVLDLFSTEKSFSVLFSELSKNLFNSSNVRNENEVCIDHLFLFYASNLAVPKKCRFDLNFCVHCIELNDRKTIDRKYNPRKMNEIEKLSDNFILYHGTSRKEKSLDNLKMETSQLTSTQNSMNETSNFESEKRFSIYDSVLIAFQNGWTHSIISASDLQSIQLIEYIKFCLKPILPKSVKISLHISPELEIAWISSNKILLPNDVNSKSRQSNFDNKNKQKNFATVFVKNFQSDFMLHVTFQQNSKSASSYEKAKYFTLQTVFEFSDGITFITNRSFKKAASLPKGNVGVSYSKSSHEWSDSINFAPFCMICLKQRASLFLMNYINNAFYSNNSNNSLSFFRRKLSGSTQMSSSSSSIESNDSNSKFKLISNKTNFCFNWSVYSSSNNSSHKFNNADLWDVGFCHVINNQEIFSPSLSIVRQIVDLFHSLFIDDHSPINEKIRLDVIYLSMTQGMGYFVILFNSLFTVLKKPDVLYFPPFLIVSRSNKGEICAPPPDVADKNHDKAVILSTIRIELDDESVQTIKNTIANATKKI